MHSPRTPRVGITVKPSTKSSVDIFYNMYQASGILLQGHCHVISMHPIDVKCYHTLGRAKSPNYCSNKNSPMKSPSFSGFPKRITEFPFPNGNILNKADYPLETVQVRSKDGCHPDNYSRFSSRNVSGTIRRRMSS